MLIGNYTVLNKSPGKFFSGGSTAGTNQAQARSNTSSSGSMRGIHYQDGDVAAKRFYGYPQGSYCCYSFMLPYTQGEMVSRYEGVFEVSGSATGLQGLPGIGDLSFSIIVSNSSRLPLDDTPQTITATAPFSIAPGSLFGNLITSGQGDSSFILDTGNPLLIATMNGVGSGSILFNTNTPLLGALSFKDATASFLISTLSGILPTNDSSVLRDAVTTISFSGVLEPFAIGVLAGESFLAGGTIDEFAVLGRMEYDNAVHIDTINGTPGTRSPLGTLASPVNNITDALIIARDLNVKRIKLLSDLTINSGEDISGYTIFSDTWKTITVSTGGITTDTEFERVSVYGELSGTWNVFIDCWVYNVTNFLGWMRGGSLERVELAPYINPDPFSLGSSYFDHVVPMYANIKSTLIMNTDTSVSFTDCVDIIEIQNSTVGCVLNATLLGGEIIIDTSCTGGDIHISGVGKYTNNSALIINETGLSSPGSIWRYTR